MRRHRLAGWAGLAIVAFWALAALLAPLLAPHPAGQMLRWGMLSPVSANAPFGTDYMGRDMLSRVIYGARYSLGASLAATLIACTAGTLLGILAAVRGGWVDAAVSRTSDTFISIPHLMFALVIVAALGSSLPVLIGLIAFSYVPGSFRIARALAVDVNAMEFVQVARARGEGTAYIVLHEIWPNMMLPVLTDFGLRFVFALLLLSSLGFLGLGIQPPNADWGALVRENMDGLYEAAPAVIMPALAIATLTIAVNLLIDGFSARPSGRRLMSAAVIVEDLCIAARNDAGQQTDILHNIAFTVAPGEVLALIGESGSGKTTTALALLGYLRRGCRVRAGRVLVGGVDALALPPRHYPDFRGRRVSYIAQSAAASFNPAHRLIDQVTEGCTIRGLLDRPAAQRKAQALFEELALPDPGRIGQRYPHQVSGGQLQRVMAAMALMTDPELIVLDEPTTALDVTTQVEVLRAFRRAVRGRGTTAVYVSHDLAVVAQMADSVVVLRGGRMQESGRIAQILRAPQHDYTRTLLDAVPTPAPAPANLSGETVLEAQGLSARYGGPAGLLVLRDVDLRLPRGAVLGVIGESGSGKSTLARVLTGLLPAASGTIRLSGEPLHSAAQHRTRQQLQNVQIVFQSADTALNPAHSVSRLIERPLAFYHGLAPDARRRRVAELLDMVRLPATLATRRPSELSGGQKQRVNLARALAAQPSVLICDEVTSALDTVVGAAVLDLLAELRRTLGIAMLFISHDLNTVRSIADDVMVMYAGRPVQSGGRPDGMGPIHPYTELLAASVPELRTGWLDGLRQRPATEATPAARSAELETCAFFDRCDVRIPGLCNVVATPVQHLPGGAAIRCCHDAAALQARPALSLAETR